MATRAPAARRRELRGLPAHRAHRLVLALADLLVRRHVLVDALVVSSAAPTDLPASAAVLLQLLQHRAMPFRILCRLAVASRYSCSAFFSPDLAVLWDLLEHLLHTFVAGRRILATAAVASAQPGGVGAAGAALLVVGVDAAR